MQPATERPFFSWSHARTCMPLGRVESRDIGLHAGFVFWRSWASLHEHNAPRKTIRDLDKPQSTPLRHVPIVACMFIVPSYGASVVRFPLGYRVSGLGPRPETRLELYEYEGCPFCRKVREAVSMLDLTVLVRPTPKGGERFRPEGRFSEERPSFRCSSTRTSRLSSTNRTTSSVTCMPTTDPRRRRLGCAWGPLELGSPQ